MNNLRFADDIILFAESEEQLTKLLHDLNNEGKKDGMKMNKRKTKIMCNDVARKIIRKGISVDGEQLEEVDEYKYLGRLLKPGNEGSDRPAATVNGEKDCTSLANSALFSRYSLVA